MSSGPQCTFKVFLTVAQSEMIYLVCTYIIIQRSSTTSGIFVSKKKSQGGLWELQTSTRDDFTSVVGKDKVGSRSQLIASL